MRTLLACLAFAFLSAFAAPALAAPHYPMPAEEFEETIVKRIEATWSRIEKKLHTHRVSEARIEEIRKVFDEAAEQVTQALDKAAADGSISRNEAYKLNVMTSGLRGKVRGKLAVERARPQKSEPRHAEPAKRKVADDKDEEFDSEEQSSPARPSKAAPRKQVKKSKPRKN
jgi:hypothetical protein